MRTKFVKGGCLLIFLSMSILLCGQEQPISLSIEESTQMMRIGRELEESEPDAEKWLELLEKYPEGMDAFGKMQGLPNGEAFVELMTIGLIQDPNESDAAAASFQKKYPGYALHIQALTSQQEASEEEFLKQETFNREALERVGNVLDSLYPDGRISSMEWEKLYQRMPKEIDGYLSFYDINYQEFIRLLRIKEEKGQEHLISMLKKEKENFRKFLDEDEDKEQWPIFETDEAFLDYKIANSRGYDKENLIMMKAIMKSGAKEAKEMKEGITMMRYLHNTHQENYQEALVDIAVKYPEVTKQENGQYMLTELSEMVRSKSEFDNLISENILHPLYAHQVREALRHPSKAGDLFEQQLNTKSSILDYRSRFIEKVRTSGNDYWNIQLQNWFSAQDKLNKSLLLNRYKVNSPTVKKLLLEQEHKAKSELEKLEALVNFELEEYSWQQVKACLKPGEAVIEISRYLNYDPKRTGEIFYVVNIIKWNSKNPKPVLLKNGEELEVDLFRQYMEEILSPQLTGKLYDAYWRPIHENLKGVEKVYFAPDGVFHQINLSMLPLPDKAGQTLLDVMNIELVTSSRSLIERQNKERSGNDALLLGGLDYNLSLAKTSGKKMAWKTLPQAHSEINAVKTILEKNAYQTTTMTNEAGRENIIASKNPGILHIASHAFFWDFDPPVYLIKNSIEHQEFELNPTGGILSHFATTYGFDVTRINSFFRTGVVLAGANSVSGHPNPQLDEDGILFGYEIARMDLTNTELVVLSACSTAKGDLNNGQGLYGLQRAFFEAGADVIIMSLWDVWDSTAKEFMEYFYTNWLDKRMDKTEAFRQAQIQLKENHREAGYLWGGFIMVHR